LKLNELFFMEKEPNLRRTGNLNQAKPKSGKKGARGQAEGIRSKRRGKLQVSNTPKKPGRQKQTAKARALKAKRSRSEPEVDPSLQWHWKTQQI
jgi:hypothetical protein